MRTEIPPHLQGHLRHVSIGTLLQLFREANENHDNTTRRAVLIEFSRRGKEYPPHIRYPMEWQQKIEDMLSDEIEVRTEYTAGISGWEEMVVILSYFDWHCRKVFPVYSLTDEIIRYEIEEIVIDLARKVWLR